MWAQKLVFILITIEFCMSHQNEIFRPIQPTSDALIKGMTVRYDNILKCFTTLHPANIYYLLSLEQLY